MILFFAKPLEISFLSRGLKILALSFLIVIGITIFMEGLKEVEKSLIYAPMGFAMLIELQMRHLIILLKNR